MGLCQSEEEKKQIRASKDIDRALRENHALEEKIIKLLLLGKQLLIFGAKSNDFLLR